MGVYSGKYVMHSLIHGFNGAMIYALYGSYRCESLKGRLNR